MKDLEIFKKTAKEDGAKKELKEIHVFSSGEQEVDLLAPVIILKALSLAWIFFLRRRGGGGLGVDKT